MEFEGADSPDAAGDQGMIDFINGDNQKAVTLWKKAVQNDPSATKVVEPFIEKAIAAEKGSGRWSPRSNLRLRCI